MPSSGLRNKERDFPGGLMARTPYSRCRGSRFDPWGPRSYTLQLRVHTLQLRSLACHNKDQDPECCNQDSVQPK